MNFPEIYATVEITKTEIRFLVGKFRTGTLGLRVIFKDRKKGHWLTDNDEVLDTSAVARHLKKMITAFETSFDEKIVRVSVVFPTNTLTIKRVYSTVFTDRNNYIVTNDDRNALYRDAKEKCKNIKQEVVVLRPSCFKLDGVQEKSNLLIGIKARFIEMESYVYLIDKKVFSSHKEVVKKAEKELHLYNIQNYSLARQCLTEKEFKRIFALTNWDNEKIDIGFFSRETLMKKITLPYGVKDLVNSLAVRLDAKYDTAEKYLLKLINFSTDAIDQVPIYRKYIARERKTFELNFLQIKKMIEEEIVKLIAKVDNEIGKELQNNIALCNIYHSGKITEIAGFKELIKKSRYSRQSLIYYSMVKGANEIWTTAICGSMVTAHQQNKASSVLKTSTITIQKDEKQKNNVVNGRPINYNKTNNVQNRGMVPNNLPPQQMGQRQFVPNHIPNNVQMVPVNMNMPQGNVQKFQNDNQMLNQNGIIRTQRNR
ncbi:cell division protein FtsA [Spiroplasma chinense]|uniref:Cell division protein FtsA n=1 Tax=Spiroplasma chinense TaxID=216932 RepID=A0A5B9Y4T8_9MOLU|nr:hypothetical protein [Spiroplasma chinense]QEH62104.1 cell division protein FtsA [Spiroplasma chinense]